MFSRWFGWRFVLACLWFIAAGLLATAAFAKGTPAGTLIPNAATLTYEYEGKNQATTAIAPVLTVAEVIDVALTWQDGSLVSVKAGESARVLTFLVTNLGNGVETFRLDRNDAVTGDNFDPVSTPGGAIYLESNGQAGVQTTGPNPDTPYVRGVSDPTLAADGSVLVYLLSDIPASTLEGAVGRVALTSTSTTPGAPGAKPGTGLPKLGDGGIDAVVGTTQAQANATGGYIVSSLLLGMNKSVVSVVDPKGSDRVMTGAVLTYRLTLTLTGTGTARALTVTDPLPATLTYQPGSLSVNGATRSDASDGDNAEVSAGVITVYLGDVVAPATHVVEFRVTVN